MFRFSLKKENVAYPNGGLQADCPFHRRNKTTGCRKCFPILGETHDDFLAARRRLQFWCTHAPLFQRQRDHIRFAFVDGDVPVDHILEDLLVADGPEYTVKTDVELDQEERAAAPDQPESGLNTRKRKAAAAPGARRGRGRGLRPGALDGLRRLHAFDGFDSLRSGRRRRAFGAGAFDAFGRLHAFGADESFHRRRRRRRLRARSVDGLGSFGHGGGRRSLLHGLGAAGSFDAVDFLDALDGGRRDVLSGGIDLLHLAGAFLADAAHAFDGGRSRSFLGEGAGAAETEQEERLHRDCWPRERANSASTRRS